MDLDYEPIKTMKMKPNNDAFAFSNRVLEAILRPTRRVCGVMLMALTCLAGGLSLAADDPGLVDKTKDAAQETAATVDQAGRMAADKADQVWQQIDAARLKNRTPDQIVAFVITGMLVGSLAGMMTSLKPTGLGQLGRLLLGLIGAFLGGIVVRVTGLNFGWGPVLIRYEELAFSLLGAVVIVVLWRFIRSRSEKEPKS
jgi:uncharacterized membrane protein YeaQ/YmgE (transglycosylase-associated protein family)